MPNSPNPLVAFTVVVPLYNKQKYIQRCLDSIARQSHCAAEVIVIDDGSTDDGPELVARYSGLPLLLVRQQNAGVSAARNAGIESASNEWIAFLDADDEYQPDFLEQVANAIQRYPEVGLVYGWSYFLSSPDGALPARVQASPSLIEDYFDYVVFEGGKEVNTSCVAVRRDVFTLAGNFPVGVSVGEDSDLWMRLAWVTTFAVIPTWLSTYHTYAGNSGWEKHVVKDAYWLTTYELWKRQIRIPERLMRSTEAYVYYYFLSRALYLGIRGERAKALKLLASRINYCMAPKWFALKVFAYVLLPIHPIRRILRGNGSRAQSANSEGPTSVHH